MMSTAELILTLGTTLIGSTALSTLISGWFGRRFVRAEANTTISDTAIKFNEQLTQRIDKLEVALEMMRKENLDLHRQIASLQTEVAIYKAYIPKAS